MKTCNWKTCDLEHCRLALHALVFGNLRAVAILWGRFVRELRFSHWETLTPLPRMPGAHCSLWARFSE